MTFETGVERVFAIDRATMWKLWTDEEHAAHWMRPSVTEFGPTIATIDPHPGGRYRFEMVAKDGSAHAASGVYVELDEPKRLTFTWSWEGSDDESLVEVTLSEVPGGTRVQLVHTKLSSQEAADEHQRGWVGCLASIETLYVNEP